MSELYLPARSGDPSTSHEAAIALDLPHLEKVVLTALIGGGPMTSHELSESLKMPLVTVSPRLRPLAHKGRVHDTGTRRVGASGRSSIVWGASP